MQIVAGNLKTDVLSHASEVDGLLDNRMNLFRNPPPKIPRLRPANALCQQGEREAERPRGRYHLAPPGGIALVESFQQTLQQKSSEIRHSEDLAVPSNVSSGKLHPPLDIRI